MDKDLFMLVLSCNFQQLTALLNPSPDRTKVLEYLYLYFFNINKL